VAGDHRVDPLDSRGLVEHAKCLACAGEEILPPALPQHTHGGQGTIALRPRPDVKRGLGSLPRLHQSLPGERVPRVGHRGDCALIACHRQRGEARSILSFEDHFTASGLRRVVLSRYRARRSHTKLPVPERALEPEGDLSLRRTAVLHRQRIHRAGDIHIAAERREHGAANHESFVRRRERRKPLLAPLPRHRKLGQVDRHPVHVQDRFRERRR
jgi:hypothetical protein